ncbi:MAG: helix-turn-helix transcriptional regulator [Actinomycetota bacterium]
MLALTQQQAADRLNVQPSSLSNWEREARAISIDLASIDDALKGEGVLESLLWAARTPEGLEPGHVWTKVFPGESCPVWAWIRGTTPTIFLEAEWGVARIDTMLEPGPNGFFITVGASVPDSPVVVHLSEPGWADFGRGELPDEIPGAQILPAVSIFSASSADGRFMEYFRSHMQAELADGDDGVLESVKRFATDRSRRQPVVEPQKSWPVSEHGLDPVDRQRFATLRQARDLSRTELAKRVSAATGSPVSRDTVRRFEIDLGQPHDPLLPVALDHVLGADGRLAALELKAGRGPASIGMPPFWRGPIWLAFEAPDDTTAVLHRNRWKRELPLSGSMLVSTHWFEPDVPLRIDVPDGVSWQVGVGQRPAAEPIDQNWEPISVEEAQDAASKTQAAISTAAEREQGSEG